MPLIIRLRAVGIAGSATNSAGTAQAPTTAAVCKDAARGAADDRATAQTRSAKSSGTLRPKIFTEGKPSLAQTDYTSASVESDLRDCKRRRLDNESRDTSQSPCCQGPLPQQPAGSAPKLNAPTKRQVKRGHGWAPRKRKGVRKQARMVVFSHKIINEGNENYGSEVDCLSGLLGLSDNVDVRAIGILDHEKERVRRLEPSVGGDEVENATDEARPPQPVAQPQTGHMTSSEGEGRSVATVASQLLDMCSDNVGSALVLAALLHSTGPSNRGRYHPDPV